MEEFDEQMREVSSAMGEQIDAWKVFEIEGGKNNEQANKKDEGDAEGVSGSSSGDTVAPDSQQSQPVASMSQRTAAASFIHGPLRLLSEPDT